MTLESLPNNLFKLIGGDGSSSMIPNLIKYLKPGMLLEGKVIKSFPEKNKAIIQLNKRKVVVETHQKLTPNQLFSARVEKIFPLPVIKIIFQEPDQSIDSISSLETKAHTLNKQHSDITSIKTKYLEPHSTKLTLNDIKTLNLTKEQSVKAKIISLPSKRTAIAMINNREVIVPFEANSPPKIGAFVDLGVKLHKNNYQLFIREEISSSRIVNSSNIKSLLSIKEPFSDMVQKLDNLISTTNIAKIFDIKNELILRLNNTLSLLKPQPIISLDSRLINDQVTLSGINYEPKVKQLFIKESHSQIPSEISKDLKGLLLEIMKRIEGRDRTMEYNTHRSPHTEIIQTLRRAVDNIELQQLSNQLSRQENQPIVLQIPNPFPGDKKSINLYLRKLGDENSDKNNKKKKGTLLVFLLDLTVLGNIRIDVKLNENMVSIKLNVESQAIVHYIDNNTADFILRLAELGFQSDVVCCVSKNIKHHFENDLNQLLINDSNRLVDLTT